MIFELPDFVSKENLEFINSKLCSNENISKLSIKSGSYRDGKTIMISSDPNLKELDSFLFSNIFGSYELINFINRRYLPKYEIGDSGYEFHRYAPGDICHIHSDGEVSFSDTPGQEVMLRFASIVLHLNTPSSGAELIFPSLNKSVKTEAGKLVIFPPYGFSQHYTTESPDNRDVIVTWFVYKDILVRKR